MIEDAAAELGLRPKNERHWGAFLVGILIGAATGVVIALLTAPKPVPKRARSSWPGRGMLPRPPASGSRLTCPRPTATVEAPTLPSPPRSKPRRAKPRSGVVFFRVVRPDVKRCQIPGSPDAPASVVVGSSAAGWASWLSAFEASATPFASGAVSAAPGTWSRTSRQTSWLTSWSSTGSTWSCPSCRTWQPPWLTLSNAWAASSPVPPARPRQQQRPRARSSGRSSARVAASASSNSTSRSGLAVARPVPPSSSSRLSTSSHWISAGSPMARLERFLRRRHLDLVALPRPPRCGGVDQCRHRRDPRWYVASTGRGAGPGDRLHGRCSGATAWRRPVPPVRATGAPAPAAGGRLVALGSDRGQGGGGD